MSLDFNQDVSIAEVDRGLQSHQVLFYHPTLDPERKVWDISELVEELRWSDDMNQAAVEINLRLLHHDYLKTIMKNGGILTVFGPMITADGKVEFGEVVRGVVFERTTKSVRNSSTMAITAFDHMIYMVKSEDSEVFKDMTASEIITYIANKNSMPLGKVEATGYKIPRLIFRKATWYDMMIVALSESRWVDGQRYILRMEKGQLNVIKKVLPAKVWMFEYGKNIFDSVMTESIQQMKNKVVLYSSQTKADVVSEIIGTEIEGFDNESLLVLAGGNDNPIEDTQKILDYGLMQHVETGATPERFADANEYAHHILESLSKVTISGSLDVPNINTVRWGDAIYIYEPLSGMAAQYYVKTSTHIISPTRSHMELSIQFEDLLPQQLFEEVEGSAASEDALSDILEAEGITRRLGRGKELSAAEMAAAAYAVPLDEPYIVTQDYGANKASAYNYPTGHTGIDLANGSGAQAMNKPVYASQKGKVIYAGFDKISGNMVEIQHDNGIQTWYAHLSEMIVAAGETVIKGEMIGRVGQTGSASPAVNPAGGPHLHYEVRRNGVTINPREFVDIHF